MTMNPLPPQAYTKDTLLKAYHWLQQQAPHIKEMAMTPDILVSLFLKASRDGDTALERPSIQNFKTELKNLAGIMDEFEGPPPAAASPPAASAPRPAPIPALIPTPTPTPAADQASANSLHLENLDSKTHALLRETMHDFNLSCETEALRMLVKIGFEKTRAFLKN